MNFLRRTFGREKLLTASALTDQETASLDGAIVKASRGELAVRELLDLLHPALVFVPLASEPRISTDGKLESWQPATVSKPQSTVAYLAAFTSQQAAQAFIAQTPTHKHVLESTTQHILSVLPQGYGIVFNVGSPAGFEWSPSGIAAYLAEATSSQAR